VVIQVALVPRLGEPPDALRDGGHPDGLGMIPEEDLGAARIVVEEQQAIRTRGPEEPPDPTDAARTEAGQTARPRRARIIGLGLGHENHGVPGRCDRPGPAGGPRKEPFEIANGKWKKWMQPLPRQKTAFILFSILDIPSFSCTSSDAVGRTSAGGGDVALARTGQPSSG